MKTPFKVQRSGSAPACCDIVVIVIIREDAEEHHAQEKGDAALDSSRRLESNWHRYQESEREEWWEEAPARRGADFRVLLESAGDSFSQFRFSEEKSWELELLTAAQVSDLPGLARLLHRLPLHQRLDLEPELVQVSTPVVLPAVASKQEVVTKPSLTPPHPVLKPPGPTQQKTTDPPADEEDQELELLLSLEKAALACSHTVAVETAREEPLKMEEDQPEEKAGEEPPEVEKKEVTEEDLEDWLDSMIS
ncbi:cell death regulator Aven isoform X2 [Synchiropus splendidus]|uniref:cell death regulator Aven isoform X2 n=1 Tax=Synchiropus splendidus TaxID=270530 RepID=UPI00237E75D9|nr:cell death regulator Aven isoform X2 [Synchiropus splendidus]